MKRKLFVCLFVLLSIGLITGCGEKKNTSTPEDNLKIVASENKTIEYEDYDNGLISLQIPKGWKVEVPPVDYIHYTFKVYNPENPNYMFIFGLKQEGFLKSEKARKKWASLYPDTVFGKLSPIVPQTAEGFYKVWNNNAKLANQIDFKYEFFPYFNDFTVVESLGKSNLGGDILRATYNSADGKPMQGLFTASVHDAGKYMMYGIDMWPLNVYNIIMMTAPEDDFINWQPILDYSLSTIQFSSTFVNGFNKEEAQVVSTVIANQKVYDQISDMIMDSWNKRNTSSDIISQKRSDATLGYERVYDTETGDIYKAYNGFTDSYQGNKYQTATDDMYTKSISGYIEKR